jgi:hypothetical protein
VALDVCLYATEDWDGRIIRGREDLAEVS